MPETEPFPPRASRRSVSRRSAARRSASPQPRSASPQRHRTSRSAARPAHHSASRTPQRPPQRAARHAAPHAARRSDRAPRRRHSAVPRHSHLLRTTLIALAIICITAVLAASYVFFLKPNHSALPGGKQISFVIAPGTSSAQISANLKRVGLIDSTTIFRFRLLRTGATSNLKAGVHHLVVGWNYERIILELQQAPRIPTVKVTIPEGSSIDQIAATLHAKLGLSAAAFSAYASKAAPDFAPEYPFLAGAYDDSLQGYLFPDTYAFPKDITIEEVCDEMLARFDQVWTQIVPIPTSVDSTARLVTIASLVEKEVSVPSERPLVASVINNRLEQGMKLQLCSTVQFLLPGPAKNKLRLTNEDLATPSPYNTYLRAGLPPGPIANPGKAALEAALKPAHTTYLYFVLTGKDGSQTFASTSAGFEAAKQKSKEVFGQ
ncbi:MAG: endolytic transglycosylase MltG [Coriobacteriia bacterium]|nr:endolytic transglycosylase MltG [Coriobacteriia bacterium]